MQPLHDGRPLLLEHLWHLKGGGGLPGEGGPGHLDGHVEEEYEEAGQEAEEEPYVDQLQPGCPRQCC